MLKLIMLLYFGLFAGGIFAQGHADTLKVPEVDSVQLVEKLKQKLLEKKPTVFERSGKNPTSEEVKIFQSMDSSRLLETANFKLPTLLQTVPKGKVNPGIGMDYLKKGDMPNIPSSKRIPSPDLLHKVLPRDITEKGLRNGPPDWDDDFRKWGEMPEKIKGPKVPENVLDEKSAAYLKKPDYYRENMLPVLRGRIVEQVKIDQLDSIRQQVEKADLGRLTSREDKIEEGLKTLTFQPKLTFMDRSYVETLVGFMDQPVKIGNVSPALGYYFAPKASFGLGPNFNLKEGAMSNSSLLGLRSFFKQDLINKKLFLQLEDISHVHRSLEEGVGEEVGRKLNHSLSAGAGYLVKVSSFADLNITVLYQFWDVGFDAANAAPFLFRMGISSFGKQSNPTSKF